MSVTVITRGEKVNVISGINWVVSRDCLDVLNGEGRVTATFRHWDSVYTPRDEVSLTPDEAAGDVAVRVDVAAASIRRAARTRPQSKSELADRIARQVTEAAREQAWKFLLNEDE